MKILLSVIVGVLGIIGCFFLPVLPSPVIFASVFSLMIFVGGWVILTDIFNKK